MASQSNQIFDEEKTYLSKEEKQNKSTLRNIEKIDKIRKKYGMYNAIAPEKIENLSKMEDLKQRKSSSIASSQPKSILNNRVAKNTSAILKQKLPTQLRRIQDLPARI